MLRRLQTRISNLLKKSAMMAEAVQQPDSTVTNDKRPMEENTEEAGEPVQKKAKQEQVAPMQGRNDRKRKIVLLLAYCGKGYYGIQRNPGFKTIEEELQKALLKCEVIPQEHFDCPQKMSFQRAARTDKGVSAIGNVVSLKDNLVENINSHLPPLVRVIAYKRATKSFNSKNQCGGRTYAYMTPTYAFAPFKKFITEEYRTTPEIIAEVNRLLAMYKGTHNFHNFTSGIKPDDPSAKRYIISFECGEPFVTDGIEFVIMRVKGQSFMLHHIRKMIGLMIAILRGYCNQESFEKAWKPEKLDIPKSPGVGLMLEQLHYDGYNKKYGRDGMHETIEWSQYQEVLDNFKKENILSHIVESEKTEKIMMKWLGTLQYHKFDMKGDENNEWWYMKNKLKKASEEQEKETPDDKTSEVRMETASVQDDADTKKESVTSSSDSAPSGDKEVDSSVDAVASASTAPAEVTSPATETTPTAASVSASPAATTASEDAAPVNSVAAKN